MNNPPDASVPPESSTSLAAGAGDPERELGRLPAVALVAGGEAGWWRLLFEHSPDGIVVLDARGKVVEANPAFAHQLGYALEELREFHVWDWDAQWTRAELVAKLAQFSGDRWGFETRHRRKDGTVYSVEVCASRLQPDGESLFLCSHRDLTARGQVEARLRASEQQAQETSAQLRSILESPRGIIVFSLDREYRYTMFTRSHQETMQAIWGVDIRSGMNMLEAIQRPDDRERARRNFDRALQGEHFTLIEEYGDDSLCRSFWEDRYSPVQDATGTVLGLTVFVIDVTSRKHTEDALRESEERYRLLVEESPEAIGIYQHDRLVYINSTGVRQFGASSKMELLGRPSQQFIHPDDHKAVVERVRRRLGGELGVYPAEVHYLRLDGSVMTVEVSASPILFGGGPAVQFIARDITERRQTEAQLRKLSRAVEQSPASVFITDPRGTIEYVNPKFTQLTGYSAAEACGQNPRLLKSGEHPPEFYRHLWQTVSAGEEWHGEFHNRKKSGELYWEAAAISPILDTAGHITHYLAVKEDITERKRVEQELHVQRDFARLVMTTMGQGLTITDEQGRFEFVNPAFATMTGRLPQDMLGHEPEEFTAGADAAILAAQRELRRQGHPSTYETRLVRAEGGFTHALINAVPRWREGRVVGSIAVVTDLTERKQAEERIAEQAALLDAATDAIYVRALDHTVTYWNHGAERLYGWTRAEALGRKITDLGKEDNAAFASAHQIVLEAGHWSGEMEKVSTTGHRQMFLCRWTLLRDAEGRPRQVLAINTDITERKSLEAQFRHAQRMEGLGALAGGIAHDLNNILAPILMTAPLLRDVVQDADARSMLETMQTCAQRGADIIKQLLTFARGKPESRTPLPPRLLLREMEKIIRETFPRNIRPSLQVAEDVWSILGDATQIHQALMNLCVNARDAMPEGGNLTLAAGNLTLEAADAATIPDAKAGDYVCVRVSDSGTGIPPELQKLIFDPFFTTKEIGKGTGLGLPSVLGIVRGHGGFVRVDSQPGQGTTFELAFPALREVPLKAEGVPVDRLPPGRGECILVVDDEPSVRNAVQRTLEKHGYRVVTTAEGREALAVFQRQHGEIQAVLTDMMMPGMDGPALVRALRELSPRLPVLGMTGLAAQAEFKGLRELGLSGMLTKPFGSAALLAELQRVLAAANQPEP